MRGGVGPNLEARFTAALLDDADAPLAIDLAIDTGFAGFLALPPAVITQLNLPSLGDIDVELADGTISPRPCYLARIEWLGTIRMVRAFELGNQALVGINFLWHHRLTIDVVVGRDVTIEPLP